MADRELFRILDDELSDEDFEALYSPDLAPPAKSRRGKVSDAEKLTGFGSRAYVMRAAELYEMRAAELSQPHGAPFTGRAASIRTAECTFAVVVAKRIGAGVAIKRLFVPVEFEVWLARKERVVEPTEREARAAWASFDAKRVRDASIFCDESPLGIFDRRAA